jgi:hypothetical protein
MGWISHIVDLLAPELAKSVRSGVSAFRSTRRKQRHRYVLKAITTEPDTLLAAEPGSVRYDLASIDRRLYIAQMSEALGDVPLFHDEPIPPEKEKAYRDALKRQRKLGLPDPKDPERQQKVEELLNEMVDNNLLGFHPPNMWVVK